MKKRTRISPELWAKIQIKFEGGRTPRELSEEFQVPLSTITTRAARNKWKRGSLVQEALVNEKDRVKKDIRVDASVMVVNNNLTHHLNLKTLRHLQKCLEIFEAEAKGGVFNLDKIAKILELLNETSKVTARLTTAFGNAIDKLRPDLDRNDIDPLQALADSFKGMGPPDPTLFKNSNE